jgi:hypothetical protein
MGDQTFFLPKFEYDDTISYLLIKDRKLMKNIGNNTYLAQIPSVIIIKQISLYKLSFTVKLLERMTEFPIDFRNRTLYAEKQ